ncbi:MAG: hypothetical protein GWN61_00695 [candidate division Zixibacteria bacterium]|nr:hypothetical protein [candidate division Zixibacteria bacterium]NIT70439.1 hypothetical protein [candidate division KSB1 bacterium]NIW97397.1 hypothetical protein [Phycisphaerae bacterium]NIU12617.1 hypothetical protein [candidate division Zixibacteria bacterium]NIV04746.1 hypothetical protein [candidate division Zixibacteria bacterium]
MPELEDSAKKQIAVAFGIPLGILEQEDVSHSTAESHHTTFWTDTIIPEAELLAEILQEHLFDGLDLKFAWRFQELEAIQAVEFKKAQGLSALLMQVNQAFMNGLVSLEEGRMIYQIGFSRMGFEEAARALEEELDQSQISIAAQQLMAQANAPPEEKPPKEGATKEIPLKKALGAAPKSVYRELARWRKTAPIRGKDFDSDIIPDHIRSQVNAMIDWVGAERAFDFLKQFDARMKIEEELREDIEKFLQEYERKMKQMFEKLDKDYQGDSVAVFHELDGVYFPAFVMDLQRTLTPHVESMVANTLSDISMGVGVAWSPAYVNKEAAEYVRNFTSLISGSISDTTKEAAQNAVAVTLETAGMTLEDAVRLMKHTFGEDRARLIAVTETTRGYSMAVTKAQSDLYSEGVTLSRVWHTGADELVCDICRPLDLAPEHMWSGQYPSGAPAHPNCRCVIGLSGKAKQLMDAEHTHRQLELSRWEAERQAILAAQQQASIAPPVMINSPFYSGKALRDLPVKEIHPMNSSADKGYFPSAVMVLDDGTPEGQVVILKPDFSPDPKSPEERIVGEALGYDLARMMGYDSFVPYTEFIQDPTRIRELETLWATLGRNDPPITGYSVQVWVDGFDRAKRAALMQAGGRSIMNVSLDKMDFAKMRWLDVLGANWDGHDENWGFMMPKDAQGNYDTAHPDWFNLISIDNGFAGAWSDRGLTISLQYFWADQTSAAGHVAAMCPIMNGAIGTDFAASDNITALELAKGLALKESNVAFDWVQNLYNSNGGGKAVEWSEAKWIDYNPNKDEYGSIYNTVMLISEQKHIAGVTANDTEFFSEVERLADDIKMQMDAAYAQGRLLLPRHFYLDSNGDLAVDDTR